MKHQFKPFKFAFLALLFLGISACALENEVEKQLNTDEGKIKTYLAEKNLTAKAQRYNTGLYQVVEREGLGSTTDPANAMHISYALYLLNGVKVASDSNYVFQPTAGAFIAGVVQAGLVMKVGGKSQFLLPSSLAFGQTSGELNGVFIERNAVLRLEVELKASRNAAEQLAYEEVLIQNYAVQQKINAVRHSSGLYYAVIKAGTGNNLPAVGPVTVNYTGKLLNGDTFDSGTNITFSVGGSQLIQGWNIGIPLMKPKEKGILLLPSALAYGATGSSGKIAPFKPLAFEIEIQ